MKDQTTGLNGRRLHHWIGRDREKDINDLVAAIAATGEIFNHEGGLVQLDGNGKLANIYPADLKKFIDNHIAGVRVVNRGTVDKPNWQREFYAYPFDEPRPAVPTWATGLHGKSRTSGPDQAALDEIYRHRLLELLPRAEAGV